MYKIYDKWPDIARENYKAELSPVNFDKIRHIVFSGMGGSGAISDVFSSILSKTNVHVCVVKGYLLPKTVDADTLVITTSISGNTIETLTVLDSARKIGCKIVAFSNGGKMKGYCEKYKIEHRHVPMLHSPRASFPSFLYSMLKTLHPVLPVKKEDVIESITEMSKLQKKISSEHIKETNPSLVLAKWITDIPVIYYPLGLQAAAIRFKNSLQENSKMHAIAEDVIETCHNGIVSWEKHASLKPIFIQGKDDYIKTKERWIILKKFFEQNNIDYREIHTVKGSILSKLINLIYLLDYSTIYHATMNGIDPTPVNAIDFIKSKISKN
jgi:glucose/mannose-6-phosphate isomerase